MLKIISGFIVCREILWQIRGLDGCDGQGNVVVAKHVEQTQFLGRRMRHSEVLFGRSSAAELECAVLFVETRRVFELDFVCYYINCGFRCVL